MTRKRPAGVLVIAIFHFIFGAGGLCVGIIQVTGAGKQFNKLAAAGDPRQADLQDRIEEEMAKRIPGFTTYEIVNAIETLIMALVLIVSGVGLLNMQAWARYLSITYAVLGIVFTIAGLIFSFLFIMPAMKPIFQEVARNEPPEVANMMETFASVAMVGAGCCGLIYPVAVLIVMLLPSVSSAFRAPVLLGPEREDDEDYYDPGERWQR